MNEVATKTSTAACGRSVPQVVLDSFWNLSDTESQMRNDHLMRIIEVMNKQTELEAKDTLEYCVQRLVKGLSSSRKQSRRGYATFLTELLHSQKVSVEECLSVAEKCYGPFQSGNVSSTISWSLLLTSFVESGKLKDIYSSDFANTFVTMVLYFGRQKRYIELFICELMKVAVKSNLLDIQLQKLFISEVSGTDNESVTSFDLFILLLLKGNKNDKLNSVVNKMEMKQISRIINETTSLLPKFHPLCEELVNHFANNDSLTEFWLKCVNENLFRSGAKEKIALGIEFINIILPLLNKIDVRLVFSQNFLKVLMPILSNTKHALHNSANHLVNVITTTLQNCEKAKLQVDVLKCFIEPPGTVMFDTISKTKFIGKTVSLFKRDAVVEWFDVLKSKVVGAEHIHNNDNYRISCVQQIHALIRVPSVMHDDNLQLNVLHFLFLYSYFDVSDDTKSFRKFKKELTEKLLSTFRDCFLKSVEFVCLSLMAKQKSNNKEVLNRLIEMVNLLISNNSVKFLLKKEVLKKWKECMHCLTSLKGKMKQEKLFHLSLVYVLLSFHLFEDTEETLDILNELAECISCSEQQTNNSGPAWFDVLADLIISMLPKASFSLRKILVSTFKLICANISEEVIKQLECALLSHDIAENEFEDEKSEEDEESEEKDEDSEESDMDTESIAEVEEENMNVDEQFRMKVASALGPAAAHSEGEESEVYLSDSEMFQVDSALAEAFRTQVKSSIVMKQKQLSHVEFKLKCLDLVNVIITQKNPLLRHLLLVANLLLDLLNNGGNGKNSLFEKAVQNIKLIATTKGVVTDDFEITEDFQLNLLRKCFSVCNKVPDAKCQCSVAHLFSWIVPLGKCQVKIETITDLFMDSLKNHFEKSNSCTSRLFFEEIVRKHSAVSLAIIELCENIAFDAKIRAFKRLDALSLLLCSVKSLNDEFLEEKVISSLQRLYNGTVTSLSDYITSRKLAHVNVILELLVELKNLSSSSPELTLSSKNELNDTLSKIDRKMKRSLSVSGKKCLKTLIAATSS